MAGASVATSATQCLSCRIPVKGRRPGIGNGLVFFPKRPERQRGLFTWFRMNGKMETTNSKLTGMRKPETKKRQGQDLRESPVEGGDGGLEPPVPSTPNDQVMDRAVRKQKERFTYMLAAVISSLGVTSMVSASVYYRFLFQTEGGEIPVMEMVGTFALTAGAAVGMEFWARWAHRALWHDSMWPVHESHHRLRKGPFELNDLFAIINAVPAITLLAVGFDNKGLLPSLCFGGGLGITVYGMAYMFVHDGLVHKRFPVGPIANIPYFRRVAAAHQIHHTEQFAGVPYGLFLGPKELEEVGGTEELEKEIRRRIESYEGSKRYQRGGSAGGGCRG